MDMDETYTHTVTLSTIYIYTYTQHETTAVEFFWSTWYASTPVHVKVWISCHRRLVVKSFDAIDKSGISSFSHIHIGNTRQLSEAKK